VTVEFEEQTLAFIDKVAKGRESTRSVVIRQFVLEGLARLSYLPEDAKKALGIPVKPQEKT
jgi:hypothetical protein